MTILLVFSFQKYQHEVVRFYILIIGIHIPAFITEKTADSDRVVHAAVTKTKNIGRRNHVLKHFNARIGLPDHARRVPIIIKYDIAQNVHMKASISHL